MKKLIKVMSICLFSVLLMSLSVVTKVSASTRINTMYGWGFGITEVGEFKNGNGEDLQEQNGKYYLHSQTVLIVTDYVTNAFDNCAVNVDNNYIGRSTDSKLFLRHDVDGRHNYVIFKVPDLTPGEHTIKLVQNKPWYFDRTFDHTYDGPAQKNCTITVVVPKLII